MNQCGWFMLRHARANPTPWGFDIALLDSRAFAIQRPVVYATVPFEVRGDKATSKIQPGTPSHALSERSSVQSGREDFVWRLKGKERFRPGESGTGLRRWGW